MPSNNRYSASEIAKLGLPGLPGTKARVIARATSEGWPFEEVKGLGGIRRLYDVPARYFEGTSFAAPKAVKVAGTIAGGSSKVDLAVLEAAMRVLSQWEEDRHVKVAEDRRSAIVAILYDYLQNAPEEGDDAIAVVLRALG